MEGEANYSHVFRIQPVRGTTALAWVISGQCGTLNKDKGGGTSSPPCLHPATHVYCQVSVFTQITILLLLIDRCPEGPHRIKKKFIYYGINRQPGS